MYSRARLLIEQDYKELKKSNVWGIDAGPISEDNFFEWSATILGEAGTDWEGGIFRLYIKFDEYYNDHPPRICFHTIPFHANVDAITGHPALDFLDDIDKWDTSCDITFILLSIQSLLSRPVIETAVNDEAVQAMLFNTSMYRQIVQRCIATSRRLEAERLMKSNGGIKPTDFYQLYPRNRPTTLDAAVTRNCDTSNFQPSLAKIAFEDYYKTWSMIATTKPSRTNIQPGGASSCVTEERSRDTNRRSMEFKTNESHKIRSSYKSGELSKKQRQLKDIDRMHQLYAMRLTDQISSTPKINNEDYECVQQRLERVNNNKDRPHYHHSFSSTRKDLFEKDPQDQEVDDLVKWTDELHTDCL